MGANHPIPLVEILVPKAVVVVEAVLPLCHVVRSVAGRVLGPSVYCGAHLVLLRAPGAIVHALVLSSLSAGVPADVEDVVEHQSLWAGHYHGYVAAGTVGPAADVGAIGWVVGVGKVARAVARPIVRRDFGCR